MRLSASVLHDNHVYKLRGFLRCLPCTRMHLCAKPKCCPNQCKALRAEAIRFRWIPWWAFLLKKPPQPTQVTARFVSKTNFFGGCAKPNSDRTKAQLRTGEQPCETREEPRYDGAQRNPQPAGPCTGPANTRSRRPMVLHASSARGSTDCLRCPCFWLLWYLLWAQEQNQLCDNGFITTVKSSQYPAPKQITAWEKRNGEGRGVNANKSLLGYLRRRGLRF